MEEIDDGWIAEGKRRLQNAALELFPGAELHLKKHHGRADALLMAEYLRRAVGTRDVNAEK